VNERFRLLVDSRKDGIRSCRHRRNFRGSEEVRIPTFWSGGTDPPLISTPLAWSPNFQTKVTPLVIKFVNEITYLAYESQLEHSRKSQIAASPKIATGVATRVDRLYHGSHLGEIWGVEIFDQGVLWPRFSRNSLVRFRNFFGPRWGPPPLGTLKIWAESDEQKSRNVRPKLVYPDRVVSCCRPTLRARFRPRSDCRRPDCPRSDCPRSTPTTQSER